MHYRQIYFGFSPLTSVLPYARNSLPMRRLNTTWWESTRRRCSLMGRVALTESFRAERPSKEDLNPMHLSPEARPASSAGINDRLLRRVSAATNPSPVGSFRSCLGRLTSRATTPRPGLVNPCLHHFSSWRYAMDYNYSMHSNLQKTRMCGSVLYTNLNTGQYIQVYIFVVPILQF